MTTLSPIYGDENGFHDPETAAAHAQLVQGGFSTPDIEADRMVKEGGVARTRADVWRVKQAAAVDVDRVRALITDALAYELLSAFGISIQDDQDYVAGVFMDRLWPMIEAYGAA